MENSFYNGKLYLEWKTLFRRKTLFRTRDEKFPVQICTKQTLYQIRANFQDNQERGCTFCSIYSRIEGVVGINVAEETILHLFWECVHVNNISIWVGNELVGQRITAIEFMLGIKCQNKLSTELVTTVYASIGPNTGYIM